MDNPLLALQVQTPDIAGSFQRGQAGAAEIQTAKLGNMLKTYALQKAQRDDARQNALQGFYQQHGHGLATGAAEDVNALAAIDPEAAIGFRDKAVASQGNQLELAHKKVSFIGDLASGILSAPPEVRPLLYTRALQTAKDNGIDTSTISPQYNEGAVKSMMMQALSVKDQIANKLKADELAETARYHRDTVGATIRGQNMTDARERDGGGWRNMTDQEKKDANLPSQATYQINNKGKIEKVAGNTSVRPIPSSALAGIQNNNTAISKIDRAIAALEANPDAVGLKTYAGDTITQRIDPKGVETRAMVADVGSQQLHDRSGAAVTISEAPRLTPFVPSVHDNAETAIKKLRNLRKQYESNNEETQAFFSPEAGYMSPPSNGKPGSSGGKSVNTGVVDFNDLPEH